MTADEEDLPVMSETMLSTTGRLVLAPMNEDVSEVTTGGLENGVLVVPKLGIKMAAAAAVRAERDALAERALRR